MSNKYENSNSLCLLEEYKPRAPKTEIYKNIDADYYGYRADDDGKLIELEQTAEKKARAAAIEEWKESRANIDDMDDSSSDGDDLTSDISAAVPTKEEMDQILLDRQKEEILRKYATPALQRAILAEKQGK